MPCARYFMNEGDLERHERSKPHKKRVKNLGEPQYSHEEAERAGGLGNYTTPEAPVYPIQIGLMTTRHKEEVENIQTLFSESTSMS